MTSTLLFHRRFRKYSGGHGKVWDYYRHAAAHPAWNAAIYLTPDSATTQNPWHDAGVRALDDWRPGDADALFLGGVDWAAYPRDEADRPVLNLIQHVRHAQPGQDVHAYLRRCAVRICVGQPVADAISATGLVRGPVLVIENGLDLPTLDGHNTPQHGVLIVGQKRPDLARGLDAALRANGVEAKLAIDWVPRESFLTALRAAEIVVTLPHPTEGFFLPALESMALGCATVVPDCIGNRVYLQPGLNALSPEPQPQALAEAVLALRRDSGLRHSVAKAGRETAARFTLARERSEFHAILDNFDDLWKQAWATTSY